MDWDGPCETRTITPRKASKLCTKPIIAGTPDGILTETGARVSFNDYARHMPYLDPHIFVCYSPEVWLWKLHERYRSDPRWTWRVAVTTPHGEIGVQRKRVAYFGFKDAKKKRNRYHIVLDANSFVRKQDHTIDDLMQLGRDVRSFCNAHGLEVRASAPGIAIQLLRHPSFYPLARRRVPQFINGEVRPHLPGGFYDAYTGAGQRLDTALYIDQETAHHYAAETTPLPASNSVRAIGYTQSEKPYARADGALYRRELRKHGLIKAHVYIPPLPQKEHFAPRLMQWPGMRTAYIWTNELPYLESLGLRVEHLIAVWGSEEVDEGIAKYAQWARQIAGQYPALKALLLMPYGLLARRSATVTYYTPGGTDTLILGNQMLNDTRTYKITTKPDVANALQLGLIQSFVRALSLDMARRLRANGHEVLSIYADGIFIKLTQGKPVPLFAPWREKGECQIELRESLRVPVRGSVRRRNYQSAVLKEL